MNVKQNTATNKQFRKYDYVV